MKILSVGSFPKERNNTTCHRSDCLKQYASVYKELDSSQTLSLWFRILYKLQYIGIRFNLPDGGLNKRLLKEFASSHYDMVWIDKGATIYPSSLIKMKEMQPRCILVHYMIDDFMNPYHKSKQILDTIPLYDHYIVNRQVNVKELKERGCKHPICVFMSYEKKFHYPRTLQAEDYSRFGGDVGFIGTYEKERAGSIKYLVDHGLAVRVWGDSWQRLNHYSPLLKIEGRGLYSEDMCKAIGAFKINIGFLRKKSRDLHTTRSSEIPACGGFMLAERTDEHLAMFEESKEAAFFSSNEELLEKCRYYLAHDEERKAIAAAGYQRCITSDYSNEGMIKKVMKIIMQNNNE